MCSSIISDTCETGDAVSLHLYRKICPIIWNKLSCTVRNKYCLSLFRRKGDDISMIDLRLNYPLLKQEENLLQRSLHKINSDELQQRLHLPPWQGFQEDRSIAAQWLSTQGGPIAEDMLSICSSSHHALIILAIAAQLRNTAVVTENFTYPGLKAIATLFGIHLVPCETDESGMLPSSLEKICQQGS